MMLNNPVSALCDERYDNQVPSPKLTAAPSWLSHAERNFIKVLDKLVSDRAFVFTKVNVSDVFKNADFNDDSLDRLTFKNNETFDFVLCSKIDLSVRCVIELDDRPHALQKMYSEYSYEPLCNLAGVPLLEIPARCGYPENILKQYILPWF